MQPKVLITASTYSHIKNFHLPYLRTFYNAGWEIHVACGGTPDAVYYSAQTLSLPFV